MDCGDLAPPCRSVRPGLARSRPDDYQFVDEVRVMVAKMTELAFPEHLAPRFGIPVPEHLPAEASGTKIREASF